MTEIPAKPIIFSGPMVRGILEDRKTKTRRVSGLEDVNKYPGKLEGEGMMGPLGYRGLCPSDYYIRNKKAYAANPELYHWFVGEQNGEVNPIPVKCRYKVGDLLWVRETWSYITLAENENPDGCLPDGTPVSLLYRADADGWDNDVPWIPSIHMFRWASRITLEVTEVRVERLNCISEADAVAEGVGAIGQAIIKSEEFGCDMPGAVYQYACLWNKINGSKYPWSSNCHVWVISFRSVE